MLDSKSSCFQNLSVPSLYIDLRWFVADGTEEMPESMLDGKPSLEAQSYSLSRYTAIQPLWLLI